MVKTVTCHYRITDRGPEARHMLCVGCATALMGDLMYLKKHRLATDPKASRQS